jgi:hypothetical protein
MTPFTEKQVGRYLRYKLAFDRLDEALEQGWLLEAISLEESIITDRLLSNLQTKGEAASSRQSLGNLIAQTKKALTGSGELIEGDVFHELDQWRDARNECVHGFCKLDEHAFADDSGEIFSEKIWETAKKGRELVDLVRILSSQAKSGSR